MSTSTRRSSEDALKKMSKVLNSLMARQDCAPFHEPVDWKQLGLYDYPKIIKRMMDLGTVKRKLERGKYKTAADCAADIRLVWTNCKTYNADGSDFYLLAEGFSRRFEDKYKKIRAEYDTGEESRDERNSLSLDTKTRFAGSILHLSGMELGHVLQTLDIRCPQALQHPDQKSLDPSFDATTLEIDVDSIDPRTFAELDRYVREKTKSRMNIATEDAIDGDYTEATGETNEDSHLVQPAGGSVITRKRPRRSRSSAEM